MNAKYLYYALFVLVILTGCRTKAISYNRDKLIKKFKEYRIYLNNEKLINLDTFYLDKDNIDIAITNNQTNRLNIFQKDKESKFSTLLDIVSFYQKEINDNDSLTTIVDGIVIDGPIRKSLKIETTAIKEINLLKKAELWSHLSHMRYGIILVVTK